MEKMKPQKCCAINAYTSLKALFLATALFHPLQVFANEPCITVCGYMPSGSFQEPVEHVLTGDSYYPECPSEISRTSSTTSVVAIPNPQAPGGVTYVQTHDSVTQIWGLVYELQGGY